MRFFGIPTKNSPTANVRKSGLIVARIIFGLVAKRKIVRDDDHSQDQTQHVFFIHTN